MASDGRPWEGSSSAGAATAAVPPRPRPRQRTSLSESAPQPGIAGNERARYEHAAAIEPTDARAALAEYREVAHGKGPGAALALYASGRLAADLGDADTAAKALRGYLARFPDGANAADARSLLDSLSK